MFGGMDVLENLTEKNSNAIGIGMISEGLETNPLFYELVWERMNTTGKIDRAKFLQRYAKARYGSSDKRLFSALNLLASGIYTPNKRREGSLENIMCARPSLTARKVSTWAAPDMYYKPQDIESAAKLYLEAGKAAGSKLAELPTFRFDLADLCRQVLADRARVQLELIAFSRTKLPPEIRYFSICLTLISGLLNLQNRFRRCQNIFCHIPLPCLDLIQEFR